MQCSTLKYSWSFFDLVIKKTEAEKKGSFKIRFKKKP